jgi:hypothetical protein
MRKRNPMRLRQDDVRLHGALAMTTAVCVCAIVGVSLTVASARGDDQVKKVAERPAPGAAPAKPGNQHPLDPYIRIARRSRDAIAAIQDYEAVFTKSELVGRTVYADQMALKFRANPFSVYLKFIGPNRNKGREVLYYDGHYNRKLVAHEPPGTLRGFVGTIQLDPTASQAMAEGRHPITEIGMYHMVDALIHQWEREAAFGDLQDPRAEFYPEAKLGNIECKVCETTHVQPQHPCLFYRTRLFVEKNTNFPIRLEQWGFPDRSHPQPFLVEEYTYTDIRTNAGLTDYDFDVRNRSYRF